MLKVALVTVTVLCSLSASPVMATPAILEKKFSNCAALTKVYPGGVAKSAKWINKGGEIKNKPTVNAKLYAENAGKDRDKDGIACEN